VVTDRDELKVTSRRALLGGLFGSFVGAVAATLGRAYPTAAGVTYVELGTINDADYTTQFNTSATEWGALWAKAAAGTALYAAATSGAGILATSESGDGVAGSTTSGTAGDFLSTSGKGVVGGSTSDNGVWASSCEKTAVWAQSQSPDEAAVYGWAVTDTAGVLGHSGLTAFPTSPKKTGVFGYAAQDATAVGVRGTSPAGRGGVFKGGTAQLKLAPSTSATHPSTGQRGDLFVDSPGRLWFCKGSTTWRQLA
jgi:hypothetical protein